MSPVEKSFSVGSSRNPRSFYGCNFLDVSDYASARKIRVIGARAFREPGLAARNACIKASEAGLPSVRAPSAGPARRGPAGGRYNPGRGENLSDKSGTNGQNTTGAGGGVFWNRTGTAAPMPLRHSTARAVA